MSYSEEDLRDIFDKTGGTCHLCGKQLYFSKYGKHFGERGAWEIDHSRAESLGGVGDLRNLRPACISCNRSKQDRGTRE